MIYNEMYPDVFTKTYDINKASITLNPVISNHLTLVSHLRIKILCNLSIHVTMLIVLSLTIASISFAEGKKIPQIFKRYTQPSLKLKVEKQTIVKL